MIHSTLSHIEETLCKHIDQTKKTIVIQAGHFSLVHNQNNDLIPLIRETIDTPYLIDKYLGLSHLWNFPMETWRLGVRLAVYALQKGNSTKLCLLVNDWQYVKKATFGSKNQYRDSFYKGNQFPEIYKQELEKYGLDETFIIPFKTQNGKINHPFLFSETKLMSRYQNYYKSSCSLQHACAQECVPLVHQLSQEGANIFINFIPSTCEIPVNMGCQQAYDLINISDLTIVNVSCKGAPSNFWHQSKISVIDS